MLFHSPEQQEYKGELFSSVLVWALFCVHRYWSSDLCARILIARISFKICDAACDACGYAGSAMGHSADSPVRNEIMSAATATNSSFATADEFPWRATRLTVHMARVCVTNT